MKNKDAFIGIECRFPELSAIWEFFEFSGIEFGSREFVAVDAAVYSKGIRITLPYSFKPSFFQELIDNCFVAERLVLHLYSDLISSKNIDNYQEYLKSNCEMIILIYDCFYVEIYCKKNIWLEKLYQTAQKISGVIVSKKYEDTDTRTAMYV